MTAHPFELAIEERACAAFLDYLLEHEGRIDQDFADYCDRHADLRAELERLAKEWGTLREETPWPQVDGYEIQREIGRGGMGVVYEAWQSDPPRKVALKVVASRRNDASGLAQFQNEVRILALLDHPSIVSIHASGRTRDGRPYFAMERVYGDRLDAALTAANAPLASRIEAFRSICSAIAHAHGRGIVHCDLKPSNILVERDRYGAVGRVRVLDFGLARFERPAGHEMPGELDSDSSQRIVGTLGYMSPERLRGDQHSIDARSDVYSLGVMLYEVLSGHHPFESAESGAGVESREALVDHIRGARPLSLGRRDRRLRGDLEAIVAKAMSADPHERYSSAAAFEDDLARWLAGKLIAARVFSARYAVGHSIRRHRRVIVWMGIVFSVLLVIASEEVASGRMARLEAVQLRQRLDADREAADRDNERWLERWRMQRLLLELAESGAFAPNFRVSEHSDCLLRPVDLGSEVRSQDLDRGELKPRVETAK